MKPCAFHVLFRHTKTHAHTLYTHTSSLCVIRPRLCHSSCDIHAANVNTDAISLLHDVIMTAGAHIQLAYVTTVVAAITAMQEG